MGLIDEVVKKTLGHAVDVGSAMVQSHLETGDPLKGGKVAQRVGEALDTADSLLEMGQFALKHLKGKVVGVGEDE